MIKIGDEFYAVLVDLDEGKVEIDLWVVSTIRAGRIYVIHKDEFTWVKRSKTTGDYGWAKNIGDWWRRDFSAEKGPPESWAKTKAAAYGKALPDVEAAIKKLTKIRAQIIGQRTKARARKA